MPRKSPDPDIDFKIFVDPSCLSAPMDEETPDSTPAVRDIPLPTVEAAEAKECDEISSWKDIHLGSSRGPSRPQSAMEGTTVEEEIDDLLDEIQDGRHEEDEQRQHEDGADDVGAVPEGEPTEDASIGVDNGEGVDSHAEDASVDISHTEQHLEEDLDDIHGDEAQEQEDHDSIHEDEAQEQEDHDSIHQDGTYEEVDLDELSVHAEGSYHEDQWPATTEVGEDAAHESGADKSDVHDDQMSNHEETSFQDEPSVHEESGIYEDDSSIVHEPSTKQELSIADNDDGQQEDHSLLEDSDEAASRRSSALSDADRRGSLRTEALIQAAARAVVAQIEERAIAAVHSHRASLSSSHADEGDTSILSSTSHIEPSHNPVDTTSPPSPTSSRHSSTSSHSQIHHHSSEENDSSSHHDSDPDVFSDRGGSANNSARSSLSFDGHPAEQQDDDKTLATPVRKLPPSRSASPRLSAVSTLSQYEQAECVVATSTNRSTRDTPRMPFRTPSDVRAIQMSSPTPSVLNGGASPRSAKRNGLSTGAASAQYYSPKSRPTPPPRFKAARAPLVLLHVTLLPLRWGWGEVLDGMDGAKGEGAGFEPSDELKGLWTAWRQLRDRVGDTVLERGVLLPHPQNDYEVLEERLLEALELPLRRRARILECGHYLGPANEMGDDEDEEESEDDYNAHTGRFRRGERRHWCGTCKGEIKYEDLGPGRVFRVKVYASNGLMKAGAWAACWKEMERVDVEVEPIVEAALHRELERLAAFQVEMEDRRQRLLEEEERARQEREMRLEEEMHLPTPQIHGVYDEPSILSSPQHKMHASPPSPGQTSSPIMARSPSPLLQDPVETTSAHRRREEARLREIYGTSPPPPAPHFYHLDDEPVPSSTRAEPPTSTFPSAGVPLGDTHPEDTSPSAAPSYVAPPSPRSPSEEAAERRTQRRSGAYQSASLPELVFQAVKVLMRDRKNVAIVVLGIFVVLLAMSPGGQGEVGVDGYRVGVPVQPVLGREAVMAQEGYAVDNVAAKVSDEVPVVTVSATLESTVLERPSVEATVVGAEPEAETVAVADEQPNVGVPSASNISSSISAASVIPSPPEEIVTEKKVVRVIETVTETVKVSVTATESVIAAQATESAVEEVAAHVAEGGAAGTKGDRAASVPRLELAVCRVEKADVCLVAEGLLPST